MLIAKNEAESGEAVEPTEIAVGVRRIQALHGSVLAKLGESGKQWMRENRSLRALAAELIRSSSEARC